MATGLVTGTGSYRFAMMRMLKSCSSPQMQPCGQEINTTLKRKTRKTRDFLCNSATVSLGSIRTKLILGLSDDYAIFQIDVRESFVKTGLQTHGVPF